MAVSIGSIVATLGLDKAPFVQGLQQAGSEAQKAGEGISGMMKLAIAGGLAAAGTAVVAGIKSSVDATVNWSNQLEKLSRELGISTEEAASLIDQANDLGVSTEALGGSLGIFIKHLGGVKDMETAVVEGGTSFEDALAGIGVTMTDTSGTTRSMTDILADTADVFASMPDGIQKTALAQTLYGRGGKDMIPILNQGGEAMRANRAEVEKLGLALSKDQVEAARKYQIAMGDMGDAVQGVKMMLGNALIPMLTNVANGMKNGIVGVRDWVVEMGKSEVVRGIFDKVGEGVRFLQSIFQSAWDGIGQVIAWASGWISDHAIGINGVFSWLATSVGDVLTWMGDTATTIFDNFATMLMGVAEFVGQIFVLIYDVITGNWNKIGEDVGNILGAFLNMISGYMEAVWNVVSAVLQGVADAFSAIWDLVPGPVKDALESILGNVGRFLDWVWTNIKNVWSDVLSATSAVWHGMWDVIGQVLAGIANQIASFFEKIPTAMTAGWAASLRSFATEVGTGLGDRATQAVQDVIDGLRGMGGAVAETINGLMTQATTHPSGAGNIVGGIYASIKSAIDRATSAAKAFTVAATKAATVPKPSWVPTSPTGTGTGTAPKAETGGGSGSSGGDRGSTASLTDPLAAAAELLAKISNAIAATIAAFKLLAGYDISKTAFAKGWGLLIEQIKIALTGLGALLSSMGFQGEAGAERMGAMQVLADLLTSIGGALSAMSTGLASIVKWIAPSKANVDAILGLIHYIVANLVTAAAAFKADGLENARLMADTASSIGAMIAATMQPLQDAAKFKPIAVGAFGALADAINRWVTGMVWLASSFKAEGLAAARDMAETASVIGGMLAAVAQPMSDAAKFKPVIAGGYGAIADAITRWVAGMVWLASRFKAEGLAAARDMAATAGEIGAALATTMQPFADAAKFKQVAAGAFGPLSDAILRWVQGLAYLKSEIERGGWTVEGATAMSAALAAVAAGLGAFIVAIAEVVKYAAAANLATASAALIADVNMIVDQMALAFGSWADSMTEAVTNAINASSLAAALMSPVAGMIDSIKAVANYVAATNLAVSVEAMMVDLNYVIGVMLYDLAACTERIRATYDEAAKGMVSAAALVAPISGIIDAIKSVTGYVAATDLAASTEAMMVDLNYILSVMLYDLAACNQLIRDTYDEAAKGMVSAAALLSPMAGIIDSIKAVVGYVQASDLANSVNNMMIDARIVWNRMVSYFGIWFSSEEGGDTLTVAATAAAIAVAALFAPVSAIIDGIKAVAGYVSATDIGNATRQMLTDMNAILESMSAEFSTWLPTMTDAATAAGLAAAAAASVLAPIKNMVDGIKAVADYVAATGLGVSVAAMLADMQTVLTALVSEFSSYTPEMVKAKELIASAAAAVGNILGTVKSMVDGIVALASLPALNPETMATNMDALLLYAEQFIAGIVAMAARFEADGVAAAAKLAESGQKIFDMGSAGLGFLDALATFGTSYITAEKMQVMGEMLAYVLNVMIWLAYQIAPTMMTAAATFAAYAQPVFDFFKTGVDFLNDLATAAMPNEDQISAFAEALRRVLGTLTTALGLSQAINATSNAISANMGSGYVLPIFEANPAGIPMPTIPTIAWPDLPGRPATGGGGGGSGGSGGGGGASGEVTVMDFGTKARQVLATIAGAPGATTDELLRQMKWRTDTGAA